MVKLVIEIKRLMTAQEHNLFGSTVNERYLKKPYTPLYVIDEEMSIKECNKRRQKIKFFESPGLYWGFEVYSKAIFEKLNSKTGETIKDPMLLVPKEFENKQEIKYKFPYARTKSPPYLVLKR